MGCNLELHVQDNEIVKVTSPLDHDITRGNLCIKGRFGWKYVQNRPPDARGDGRGRARGRVTRERGSGGPPSLFYFYSFLNDQRCGWV